MITIDKVYQEWKDRIDHPVVAVETGCAFMWNDECIHNLSTLHIVEQLVKPTGGKLYSLDNDPNKIGRCYSELEKRGLHEYVEFMLGDSVDSMVKLKEKKVKANFILLDSLEDSNHAKAEHNIASEIVADKYILCVDDYDCPNSVKWQEVSKWIKGNLEYKTYDTPTGLIVGYKGPKIHE